MFIARGMMGDEVANLRTVREDVEDRGRYNSP